jgi:penicillin V acylase-like amidase (Ntn superfamily)
VADANGKVATIEFLNGKMVVHKGSDLSFPVLTNNTYDESVKSVKNSSSNGNNSLERFGQACKMIQQLNTNNTAKPLTDYAFNILEEVAQGDFTKWSIVYDITNKTIQFKTNRFLQIKTISFSAFDFNCSATAKVWDMNQKGSGSVNTLFQNFNNDINKRIVETAAKESESNVSITPKNIEALWQYALKIKCQ